MNAGVSWLGFFSFFFKQFLVKNYAFSVSAKHVIQVAMFKATVIIIKSSNGNILHVTGLLWGESTGNRWIPLTKASGVELWCFLWSAPEQMVEQTIKMPVIWDTIGLIMSSL